TSGSRFRAHERFCPSVWPCGGKRRGAIVSPLAAGARGDSLDLCHAGQTSKPMLPMERTQTVPLTVRMSTSVHFAAQFLSPGSGGIARCARLTIMALTGKVSIKNAFAVQDTYPTTIAGVTTRPFRNSRLRFASAHMAHAFRSDLVFYDFPGTARA